MLNDSSHEIRCLQNHSDVALSRPPAHRVNIRCILSVVVVQQEKQHMRLK